jgi:predicted S18 family serine protease
VNGSHGKYLAIESEESRGGTSLVILVALVMLIFTALLMIQNGSLKRRMDENTLAIENLSSQVESMAMENSELISQNQYLEDALEGYQEKVRSYQAEVYRLRQIANLTSDNSTVLAWNPAIRMIVPAVLAETSRTIWGVQITGYVGIVTNLTLEAVPGRGRVLVDTIPLMGEVFQDTAVTAKETAERLTGKSLFDYDLVFSIEAPDVVPSVDGPSAGAAMTLMILSLLEEKPIDPKVSLTGTVSPDGQVGAIGGVVEKAIAAENAGAEVFCIPRGNEYTRVTSEKRVRVGPIVYRYPYREDVKTVTLIEDETDLTVVIVDSVLDLVEIATYKEG